MNAYGIALELYVSAKAGVGDTVDRDEIPLPTDGYYVGGLFPSLVYNSIHDVDRGELAWWIGSNEASFYGVWTDEKTGKIYFDGSSWVYDLASALTVGRERGELAIWDISNGDEIRCNEISEP